MRSIIARWNGGARSLQRDLQSRKQWFPIGVLVLYIPAFCAMASRQAFWFDELFTVYLASLASNSVLLAALSRGADLAPPLFHLITHAFVSWMGIGHLSVRLPSILGFGLMGCCLFVFVSRRLPTIYAAIAMLLPFITGSQRYAIEARPYGLVLGFCGLALVCWQSAAEGSSRKTALLGLSISLAAAISVHYYAGLMLVALGAGEAVRDVRSRRLDLAVWAAMCASVLPLPFHLSWIHLSKPYLHNAWSAPSFSGLLDAYEQLTSPVLLISAATAAVVMWLGRLGQDEAPDRAAAPVHEWVAAGVLLMLPLLVFLVAVAATGVFVPRYALPAVLGFAVLASFMIHSAEGKSPIPGVVLFSGLLLVFIFSKFLMALQLAMPQDRPPIPEALRANTLTNLPIVIDSPFRFLQWTYYGPPDLKRRMYYLADPKEARRQVGSNAPDIGLLALSPWAPIQVKEFRAFLADHRAFLLYWQPDTFGWLLEDLSESGARIQVRNHRTDQFLLLVSQE